jgi:hypothetical protein
METVMAQHLLLRAMCLKATTFTASTRPLDCPEGAADPDPVWQHESLAIPRPSVRS